MSSVVTMVPATVPSVTVPAVVFVNVLPAHTVPPPQLVPSASQYSPGCGAMPGQSPGLESVMPPSSGQPRSEHAQPPLSHSHSLQPSGDGQLVDDVQPGKGVQYEPPPLEPLMPPLPWDPRLACRRADGGPVPRLDQTGGEL